MKVLMLGWEFPPYISGGLGTACHGLTRAMDRRNMNVTFVLPKSISGSHAEHVSLVSPAPATAEGAPTVGEPWIGDDDARAPRAEVGPGETVHFEHRRGFRSVEFVGLPSDIMHPYQQVADEGPVGEIGWVETTAIKARSWKKAPPKSASGSPAPPPAPPPPPAPAPPPTGGSDYGSDLLQQVQRYAQFCLAATRDLDFDVIHAHDWMTYPAGLWVARVTGKPLVVHVHSTEFDRSGSNVNQLVYDVERRGMHGAMRVITVSQLTKNMVVRRYGVPAHHVEVVYNGVELEPGQVGITGIRSKDKIVLYFGRITFQKGPEYFVAAAKRVLDVMPDVKFVVAGSGDMARRMIEMAAELGIGHKMLFTGFLRGNDIKRVFSMADLYVMPSVSEPFGISPLEAMSHDVPVLISKTSGVSEILTHALKVDFWDTEDMANKIVAVLRHPPLSQTLRTHGAFEVRRLTWDGAAQRCEKIYHDVVHEMGHLARPQGVKA